MRLGQQTERPEYGQTKFRLLNIQGEHDGDDTVCEEQSEDEVGDEAKHDAAEMSSFSH